MSNINQDYAARQFSKIFTRFLAQDNQIKQLAASIDSQRIDFQNLQKAFKLFEAKHRQKEYHYVDANKFLSERMKLIEQKVEEITKNTQTQNCDFKKIIEQINASIKSLPLQQTNNQNFKDQLGTLQSQFSECIQNPTIGVQNIDFKATNLQKNEHQEQVDASLQEVQEKINDIYEQSWKKRSAQGEYLKFLRDEQNLSELYKNYSIRSSSKKSELSKICSSFRQVRGDGNCFYTAFGVQFFDVVLYSYSETEYEQFIEKMNGIIKFQINYGQGKSIESQELQQKCWDVLKQRLNYLRKQDKDEFIKHYQAYEFSDNLIDGCFYGLSTIFFRNLANNVIDQSPNKSAVFDQYNLLKWEEECNSNEVVIAELAKFLKIHIQLIFFDQGSFEVREYSQEMNHVIILLIRPGHYNIGYPAKDQVTEEF